jgi:hypothetical protein
MTVALAMDRTSLADVLVTPIQLNAEGLCWPFSPTVSSPKIFIASNQVSFHESGRWPFTNWPGCRLWWPYYPRAIFCIVSQIRPHSLHHVLFCACHPTSLYHTDLPTVSFGHAQINALSNFSGRGLSQNTTLEFASVAEKIPNTWKTIMIICSEIRNWYVGEVSRVPWSKR